MFTQPTIKVTNLSELDPRPNKNNSLTAPQLQALFDKFGADFQAWFIATHLAELQSVANGTSGADLLGVYEDIVGSGASVRNRLDWLYTQIASASAGTVVDGSLGDVKLSTASTAILARFAAHLTGNTTHIYVDQDVPTTTYKLVVKSGKPYLEVVSV